MFLEPPSCSSLFAGNGGIDADFSAGRYCKMKGLESGAYARLPQNITLGIFFRSPETRTALAPAKTIPAVLTSAGFKLERRRIRFRVRQGRKLEQRLQNRKVFAAGGTHSNLADCPANGG